MLQWIVVHLLLGWVGTWMAMRYAIARKLFDFPGDRRSHESATARGGGAGIVVALMIAALMIAFGGATQRWLYAAFACGLALVAGVGLVDDHRPLSPWSRLLAHLLAALAFTFAVAQVLGNWPLAVAAFIAVMALVNIWNFMDGINGLAASQAAIAGAALAVAATGPFGWIAAALAAACMGFLPYNFPRAKIFLGDVGSGAIGFAIAAIAVLATEGGESGASPLLVLFPLSAFLLDAGLTLLRRLMRRERWWTPHTQHAYQVWARRVGHAPVTLAYAGWTLVASALMLLLRGFSTDFILPCLGLWYLAGFVVWWLLQGMESKTGPKGHRMTRTTDELT